MPEYRRINQPGGLYFFTVVSFNRLPLFSSQQCRDILHFAWHKVQSCHPFETITLCLLPEHIHAIWKLPDGDADYPMRWKEIKRIFTREYIRQICPGGIRNESHKIQGEAAIWQRRYWAYVLFDQNDLNNHFDYIHINPLKHGLVNQVSDWPWSTFHGYMKKGIYPVGWGGKAETQLLDKNRGE
jgi:putative transposase